MRKLIFILALMLAGCGQETTLDPYNHPCSSATCFIRADSINPNYPDGYFLGVAWHDDKSPFPECSSNTPLPTEWVQCNSSKYDCAHPVLSALYNPVGCY